jgi:hypothetical protein
MINARPRFPYDNKCAERIYSFLAKSIVMTLADDTRQDGEMDRVPFPEYIQHCMENGADFALETVLLSVKQDVNCSSHRKLLPSSSIDWRGSFVLHIGKVHVQAYDELQTK